MKATIVIPSYWGRSSKEPLNLADEVYDHPTPTDEQGTLERALNSFEVLKNQDFNIAIIGVSTNPELEGAMERKLRSILDKFKSKYRIVLICESDAQKFCSHLNSVGKEKLAELISLRGYSNVRNMCLIAAKLLNSDIAILFDDDEIFEDPDYVDKALEFIGREHQGRFVGGIAGYYVRPDGNYLISYAPDWRSSEWDGAAAMNEAFRIIGEEPRLKPTPFAFGGNMVIHRRLFESIPFDPNIKRGEDIDYLVNCRMFGHDFLLDNALWIKHLPPKGHSPSWLGFRQNVLRFVYMREKLLAQRRKEGLVHVPVETLDPYPGRFLRDDLHDRIYKTSVLMGLDYLSHGDLEGFHESMRNIEFGWYQAIPKTNPFEWYLEYQNRWSELMSFLSQDTELSSYAKRKLQ